MLKKEIDLIIEKVVEAGKGLALAELQPNEELKKRTTQLMRTVIDDCKKQLELYCSDAKWREKLKRKGN